LESFCKNVIFKALIKNIEEKFSAPNFKINNNPHTHGMWKFLKTPYPITNEIINMKHETKILRRKLTITGYNNI